ncbi:uncharacterized protein [Centroberyx affinis]|uniref:uncharacterized protein n=1 Tax=Centroberyx affinis TaxID=166261 RepID=UPI003A5BF09C
MRDCTPWSSGSNTPLYQPETPTVARVLFGSPEPDNTEARQHARHKVMFCLNQPEDKEPMLSFTLNQSETEEQFEEQVFRGFSNEDYGSEASPFGRAKSKIYLKEETPIRPSRTQNAPDSQHRGSETNSLTQLSDCTDMDSSCAGLNNGPLVCCELSPSYSSRGGYFSSDSDDDEDGCQSCLHSGSSCMDQACSAEAPNPNQGSQGNPKQGHSQPGPLLQQTKPKVNFRDDQRAAENMACNDETCGNSDEHIGSRTAQFVPQSQLSEIHKCKMTSSETRDAATQTSDIPACQTSDASTQCSFVPDRPTDPPEFNLYKTPVDVSVENPATGRQTGCRDAAAEQNTQRASSDGYRRGGEHPPWSKLRKEHRAGQLSISGIINKYPTLNTDSRVMIQKPTNRFLEALHMTDGRAMSSQDGGGRDERGKQDLVENGPLMKALPEEEREEVASAGRVNRLSEEAETLQEIADILLMLKQRKKEG